jgi:hypothetical protein
MVGVMVKVLVAAAAVSAADVAACSSGEGSQAERIIANRIRANPILNFLVAHMINLLFELKDEQEFYQYSTVSK